MNEYIRWYNDILIRRGMVGRNNDAWLVVEVMSNDEYRLKNLQLNNINTIVDIGASIGVFAVLAHQLFPTAKISCVDPNPHTFDLLKLNTQKFSKVVKGCVSYNKNSYMVFSDMDCEASITTHSNDGAYKVKSYKLRDIIPNGCDLLKMDCEGIEYDIFEQEDLSNVRYIIGEWHNTEKWYPFMINYIAKYPYWKYTTLKQHEVNGNFYMRNLMYE
jgi:FkbM family methyltransferase